MNYKNINSVNLMLGGDKPDILDTKALWVAVDSGLDYLLKNRVRPLCVIGDFDSIVNKNQEDLSEVFFVEKDNQDQTDTEFAIDYLVGKYKELQVINLYGATGKRLDHFFANVMLLSSDKYKNLILNIFDNNNWVFKLDGGKHIIKKRSKYKYISFLPIHPDTYISLFGAKYDVNNYLLERNRANATSNEFLKEEIIINLTKECLVIYSKD